MIRTVRAALHAIQHFLTTESAAWLFLAFSVFSLALNLPRVPAAQLVGVAFGGLSLACAVFGLLCKAKVRAIEHDMAEVQARIDASDLREVHLHGPNGEEFVLHLPAALLEGLVADAQRKDVIH